LFRNLKQLGNHRTVETAFAQRPVELWQGDCIENRNGVLPMLVERQIQRTDFRALLSDLHRPQMLIRAARIGLTEYRRDRDLKRLIDGEPAPDRSVPRLLTEEDRMEQTRQRGDAGYSVARHIEVMIALMAEVSLLPRIRADLRLV
jgi:hypothetical protein